MQPGACRCAPGCITSGVQAFCVPSKIYVLPDSGLGEPNVGTMFAAPGIRNPELIEDLLDQTLWFLLPGRGN
jgi:hypothetical protein